MQLLGNCAIEWIHTQTFILIEVFKELFIVANCKWSKYPNKKEQLKIVMGYQCSLI